MNKCDEVALAKNLKYGKQIFIIIYDWVMFVCKVNLICEHFLLICLRKKGSHASRVISDNEPLSKCTLVSL